MGRGIWGPKKIKKKIKIYLDYNVKRFTFVMN